jgi:hypothetical protein
VLRRRFSVAARERRPSNIPDARGSVFTDRHPRATIMSRADPAGVAAAGAGYLSHSTTKRAEYLGTVQATDERAAEAAIAAFELDEHRRKRLVVRFAKASKAPATRAAYVRFSDFRAWGAARGD